MFARNLRRLAWLERALLRQMEMRGDLARCLGWRKLRRIHSEALDERNRGEPVMLLQKSVKRLPAGEFVIRASLLVLHAVQQFFWRTGHLDKADLCARRLHHTDRLANEGLIWSAMDKGKDQARKVALGGDGEDTQP